MSQTHLPKKPMVAPPKLIFATCKRGHRRTDENLAGDGRTCLRCRKITDRMRYSAIKGIR